MKTLHLVIPGLLGPWSIDSRTGLPTLEVPALERLLGRASLRPLDASGPDATLFRLFGLPSPGDRDLPVAAITRLADGGSVAEGWWLRADLVSLHADLRQVLLFDARSLQITAAEAVSLAVAFNRLFAEDGWALEALHPERWYLRLDDDPGLRTHPLWDVIGKDISGALPGGQSSQRWRAALTEIQMLFYNDPLNAERESRGLRPINSVWFWGGGRLPSSAHCAFDGIYANDPLTCGLARLAGVPRNPLPANAAAWQSASDGETETLVVLESTRFDQVDSAIDRWVEHIKTLERDWFSGCLAMLKGKALNRFSLYPCNGQVYELTPRHLGRFWRRSQALLHYCVTHT